MGGGRNFLNYEKGHGTRRAERYNLVYPSLISAVERCENFILVHWNNARWKQESKGVVSSSDSSSKRTLEYNRDFFFKFKTHFRGQLRESGWEFFFFFFMTCKFPSFETSFYDACVYFLRVNKIYFVFGFLSLEFSLDWINKEPPGNNRDLYNEGGEKVYR